MTVGTPEQAVQDATRQRGRRREAVRVEVLCTVVTILAAMVAFACMLPTPDDQDESAHLLSAALLESELLLVAGICVQLIWGRKVTGRRRTGRRRRIARLGGWTFTLLPSALSLIALVTVWHVRLRNPGHGNPFQLRLVASGSPDELQGAVFVLAIVVLLALLICLFGGLPDAPPQADRSTTTLAPEVARAVVASARDDRDRSAATPTAAVDPGAGVDRSRDLVVCMSGGGIRSAAFCLGGYNAVQQDEAFERRVRATIAVSGGSYLAAAMALTRAYDASGNPRVMVGPLPGGDDERPSAPLDPHGIYAVGSPELAHLRRNGRYLWQPWWSTWSGALQLLGGALTNLFLAIAVLRALSWGLGWFLPRIGVLDGLDGFHPRLNLWSSGWPERLVGIGPWVVAAALISAMLVFQTHRRRQRDDATGAPADLPRTPSSSRWARSVSFTTVVVISGLLGLVLVPGLIAGLSGLAYSDQPTATAARVIVNLGLTRPLQCEAALRSSAGTAFAGAQRRARLTHSSATAGYGACGVTGSVGVPAPPARPTLSAAQVRRIADQESQLGKRGNKSGVSGQLTGVGAVLAAALALVQRGFTFLTQGAGQRFQAVRRWLLLRLPLGLLSLLALWLLVLWTYQYAISAASQTALWSWLVLIAGAVMSFVNPNLTSLNEFYRQRLSSAFAVGRVSPVTAEGLPYDHRYLFSQLPETPELVVCATANVNDPAYVPSRRGGVPMTFSRDLVRLEVGDVDAASGYVATPAYEQVRGGPALTVMGAVAMSGAAVSPLMGRNDKQMAPFRLLLTLLNIRLGVWMRNPRWPIEEPEPPWWSPMAAKPQFQQLIEEAFGSTLVDDRWIYITDGGHLDNLGLVEAARREPRRVLVLSASNDPDGSWQDVGAAVSVIRADLGLDLRVVARDPAGTWLRLAADVSQGEPMEVLVVRAALPTTAKVAAQVPVDVAAFRTRSADFPRASTGRQDFGDLEFEAYRQLGEFLTSRALRAARWPQATP